MDPHHPESEAPEPGAVPREAGGISARVAQYCEMGGTERTPPPIDESDPKLDTIPAPGREERRTLPPGPVDRLPDYQEWERGLDVRFDDIRRCQREEQDAFEERMAARLLAIQDTLNLIRDRALSNDEALRQTRAVQAELQDVRAHCRECPSFQPPGTTFPPVAES